MFRSMTIITEFVLHLSKLILKHSVKLRRYILCGDVAACHRSACVLCTVQNETISLILQSTQRTTHKPIYDMLPHHHTIYNDEILLSVLI